MITYFFRTYGCQANVADSEGLAKYLNEMGATPVMTEESADLIIVNTCAVREKAEQKLWSYLGKLAPIKRTKPFIKIGVIGCVASYKKKEIYDRFDQVNFVYGAREELPVLQAYLTDVVVELETTKQHYLQSTGSGTKTESLYSPQDRDVKKVVEAKNILTSASARLGGFAAFKKKQALAQAVIPKELNRSFINIMTGCNKYCAYCIVPFTRGREVSYPMNDILERVRHDVHNGAKEITLVGQNVNSYVDPVSGALFPELLRRVAEIEGNFWTRYISPHPQDMTADLFDVMKQYRPKIAGSLHFPLQSGSNTILKAMNRNYSSEEFLEKIGWIRQRMSDATISTDIIVGFPGETENDFAATMDALEKVRFDLIYSFIYSPRKYTKAWKIADDCDPAIKSMRLEKLQERQTQIAFECNSLNIGKILTCLVEKRLETGKLLARTEGNIRVIFDGNDDCIDQFVQLKIESTGPANMHAQFVSK